MELVDLWDDGEQRLVIVGDINKRASSCLTITNPFGPEMVAVNSDMESAEAPAQSNSTPNLVPIPEPSAQTPEMISTPTSSSGVGTGHAEFPNSLSIEAIKASLNRMLEAARGDLASPEVGSTQNLWGSFNMESNHFLCAPNVSNSLTAANSTITSMFAKVSEAERNKLTTELIMNCIQKQSALWDSTDPMFGDSKLCPMLWSNIASVCGLDVRKLKTKWNSLKKTFKKEYIKCATTGLASKSPHFRAMSFLEGEIERELLRERNEKNIVVQQLQRRSGGTEQQVVSGPSVVHNLDEDEDDEDITDSYDDDCMIVESVPLQSTSRTKDTSDPLSSQASNPRSGANVQIDLKIEDDNLKPKTPADIKQCARKSTSRANLRIFSSENGFITTTSEHSNANKVPRPEDSTAEELSAKNDKEVQWKIENPRTIEVGEASIRKLYMEAARSDLSKLNRNAESTITILPAPKPTEASRSVRQQNTETTRSQSSSLANPYCNINPTVAILPKPRLTDTGQTSTDQHTEPTRINCSKLASDVKPTNAVLPKPPMQEDEIQIIKEVPGLSVQRGTSNTPTGESRKRETTEDQSVPIKKPRVSDAGPTPPKVTTKRKVDKEREKSANEHFLLSLLYDVENMSNEQFRRLKKHSTALASMILDPE